MLHFLIRRNNFNNFLKMDKKILFLGCGKMGSILLANLVEISKIKPRQIAVIKNNCDKAIFSHKKSWHDDLLIIDDSSDFPPDYCADIIFISVKPQDAILATSKLLNRKITSENTIFISILAGKTINFLEEIFKQFVVEPKIVRTMPNLPIQHGKGIFAYKMNKNLQQNDIAYLESIFSSFGELLLLENEELFNVVTAIFGSGPAYIFLLQEILVNIATKNGIKEEQAVMLVNHLFFGSSLMVEKYIADDAKLNLQSLIELREQVTSKKGTTESAIAILTQDNQLHNIFIEAIDSAIARSKSLSS